MVIEGEIEVVFEDIHKLLKKSNHPLSKHKWSVHSTAKNYRQVSVFEDDSYSFLHYELMKYSNGFMWEFHPEGNRRQKEYMTPYVSNYSKKYKRVHWKPNISGKYRTGEFFKIVPKKKIKLNPNSDSYEELLNELMEQFVQLYEETNDSLIAYLTKNKLVEQETISTINNIMETSRNTILYGPPGTGKTYNTVNKAIQLVDPDYKFQEKREDITKHFQSLLYDEEHNPNGQIVFSTFHQSMAYEDFIEGIKPNISSQEDDEENTGSNNSNNGIDYIVKDGVFKELVSLARKSTKSTISFEKLWEEYLKHLDSLKSEKLFTSVSSELKLDNIDPKYNSIRVRFKKSWNPDEEEGTKAFIVSKNMIERLFLAKVDGSEENKKGRTDVSKHVGAGRATHIYSVYKDFYAFSIEKGAFSMGQQLNYVIIIDEINRGNVSAIFGELITLIEEDKRIGKENELSVILPYSRDKFTIPSNLYIIGTMNTADRSVEALDTALRRRFSFEEMMPNADLLKNKGDNKTGKVSGVDLSNLLSTINSRIEVLIDRDHTIGHSYFMDVNTIEGLKNAFKNKITPLLQEYFYGDYKKMEMVIGQYFFDQEMKNQKDDLFAVTESAYNIVTGVFQMRNMDDENFNILDAIAVLLKTKTIEEVTS